MVIDTFSFSVGIIFGLLLGFLGGHDFDNRDKK